MERPYKRRNPSGKTVWRVRGTDARTGERVPIGTFKSRQEAEEAQVRWHQERALGLEEMSLAAYFEVWKSRRPRPSARTNRSNWQRLERYVVPVLGGMPVHEVRRRHVVLLRDQLIAQGLAAKMVRNILASLSSMLSDAVEDEVAEVNPALRVKVAANDPRVAGPPPRRKRLLTYDLMLELADAAPHPYGGAVLFPGVTGARPAEVFPRLHSDLDRRNLRVMINSTAYDGRVEHGTKTDHGHDEPGRWSIVTPELLRFIDEAPRAVTGLLWPTPQGKVWRLSNFYRKVFGPARKRAGLSGVTMYDLRHSFISLMQEAGIPVADLASCTGHVRVSTLQDVYTHALGRSSERMRGVLRT
jgi:integrase